MGYLLDHLPTERRAIHEKTGWGTPVGFGESPALLVIDMAKAWTDPKSPYGTDMSNTLANINRLLAVARETKPKIPIVFTTMSFDPNGKELMSPRIKKQKNLKVLLHGSKWVKIDPILERKEDEFLLVKKHASSFMFTNLVELLTAGKVDTVVISGCSISGCVLATSIDSSAYAYRTIVVEEAVADRDPEMGSYALLNIATRWADIVSLDEAIKYLSRFKG